MNIIIVVVSCEQLIVFFIPISSYPHEKKIYIKFQHANDSISPDILNAFQYKYIVKTSDFNEYQSNTINDERD